MINFCLDLYDENCKKYAQNTQKSFTKSLKTILTQGLKKPIAVNNGVPSIEFKLNKATGKYEALRIRRKRKNMEIEPEEVSNYNNERTFQTKIPIEKEKEIKPQLKRQKENFPKRASVGGAIAIKLSKQKNDSQKIKQRKSDIFVDKLGQSPKEDIEEEVVVEKPQRVKSPPFRNLVFEEDRHCNRSTDTDSGMGDVKLGALKVTKEQCSQTSGNKQSKNLMKTDISCQTSPLRSKSFIGLGGHPQKSYDEIKEERLSRQQSSNHISQGMVTEDKSKEYTDNTQQFSQQSDEIKQDLKEKCDIVPENGVKVELAAARVLNFESHDSQISTEAVNPIVEKPSLQRDSLPTTLNIDAKEESVTTKPLFSPQKVNVNRTSTPTKILEQSNEGKISLKLKPINEPNKPTFDFLKPYEAKEPLDNTIHENNPFLRSFGSPKDAEPNTSNELNPFLASQNTQLGILGLIERNSSDKKSIKSLDGSLKPVTNLGLFGDQQTQPMLSNNILGNNISTQNPNNGLFTNINNSNSNNLNNPNNMSVSNNLFGNMNNSNYAPSTKPTNLFANKLFNKDEMDITESKSSMNNVNTSNNLFGPNVSQNNNMTSSFLPKNNNEMGNSLFNSSMNINSQPMNNMGFQNGPSNSFSNNLFGGNNMANNTTQPANNSLFSNSNNNLFSNPSTSMNNNNNQFSNNLFAPGKNSSGFMPNQLSFNNQPSVGLFNSMETSNNNLPNKLSFSNQSMFENKPSEMQNMNLFANNNNNNFMSQQFPGSGMGPNLNNAPINDGRALQDANNFLGLGNNNNNNNTNSGANNTDGNRSDRVFRRIIQPQNKNRDRAF